MGNGETGCNTVFNIVKETCFLSGQQVSVVTNINS